MVPMLHGFGFHWLVDDCIGSGGHSIAWVSDAKLAYAVTR